MTRNYSTLPPPPYAKLWQRWADTLYAYQLLSTRGAIRIPSIKLVGNVYCLSDDKRAWSLCAEGYRDYDPKYAGGRDWSWATWPESVNELDFRLFHETCRTLLPKGEAPESKNWAALARPFLWVRLRYDAASKARALSLAAVMASLSFNFVYALEMDS